MSIVFRQETVTVRTEGRGTYDISDRVAGFIAGGGVQTGLCHVFIRHTSASLLLCENADPAVLRDLEAFLSRIAPDGDPLFTHTAEGPDDMPAHIRSILTQSALSVPVVQGRCALGTWQGVFVYEHRHAPHSRQVVLTLYGDGAAG